MYTISEIEVMGVPKNKQVSLRKKLKITLQKDVVNGRKRYYYTEDQVRRLLEAAGFQQIDKAMYAKGVVEL